VLGTAATYDTSLHVGTLPNLWRVSKVRRSGIFLLRKDIDSRRLGDIVIVLPKWPIRKVRRSSYLTKTTSTQSLRKPTEYLRISCVNGGI